jgi:outer membrane protein assembly factor BamA
LYAAGASFALASVVRPGLIGVMPFKEKKDRQYSQASAIAAGVVELGASVALFTPVNKVIQKASDNLFKTAGTVYHNNPQVLRQFKSITNRGIKVLSLIPISLLRFSLVKPIVNVCFGGKNENK